MSIQSTNTKLAIATHTGLIPFPVSNMTIAMQPEPYKSTLTNDQIQEGLRLMSEGITIRMQVVVQAFTQALKPVVDALQQFWINLGKPRKKKRPSKQTRAFLVTKYKSTFTPHAQRRRRSSRRLQVYQMKASRI